MRRKSQSGHQAEVKKRLRFETLLADLCAEFVNVSPSDLDSKIEDAQRLICESLRLNHSSVWQMSDDDSERLVMTHAYRDPTLKPLPTRPVLKQYFPWSVSRVLNKETICIRNTAKVPSEAATDRNSWLQYGVRSTLAFPLSVGGGQVVGFLAFDSTKERDWQPTLQRRLQILAHVFAQALDRKRFEQDRRRREEKLREYERAVENAEEMIAVVDREYRYLIANRQFLKLRNMTREQVVGQFVRKVLEEGVFEAVVKPKLDECFQGRVVRYEMEYTYAGLGERDILVSYFPIEGANGIDWATCILLDITDRKRAEETLLEMNRTLEAQGSLLRSREELLRVFVKNVPAAVAMLDRDMRYLQVSDRWCTDYLPGRAEILGRSHYEIFPDMPERWKEVHSRALQGETLRAEEDHWDGQDGTHWARWEVRPWRTAEGTVGGILILAEDITPRKQMEEALSDMSRKLIESQEQERTRIGRELHDDINQRLALLTYKLEQLKDDPSAIEGRIRTLQQQITEIADDVQALSHELHSSKLDYLGVVGGIRSWCKEFAERQGMEIEFKADVASTIPSEIGVTLFRILQEALHNAVKHSGVKRIEVQLREDSGEIHLVISDLGRGFEVEAALQGTGLGLTSMRERVRLVNGTITIESKPSGGTTIHVRVPLGSEKLSKRAAG